MAVTTTNMGLKEWDLPGDVFSHSDLVANWNAVDTHDHSAGKGVQIPTGGISNGAITNVKLAANAVDGSKVQDGTLSDTELASPNSGVYRTIFQSTASITGTASVGTYIFSSAASTSGAAAGVSGSTGAYPDLIPLTAADYAVAGKLTKLRVLFAWATNAVAPTSTFTAALYPISSLAGNPTMTTTLGALVTGSTVAAVAPSGSAANSGNSGDFTFPTNAVYVPGFVISVGSTAATSVTTLQFILQIRHV